ncbi:MAG: haloalkane dehalogenase [Ktedonobacterales bacterium]
MDTLAVLRTPDERFVALPDFPYLPHYVELPDLRVHYIEAGPHEAAPIVLMHGEPSWSFLYRKMVPVIAAAGFRVIAPDLVGFGRSDKPVDRTAYTYQRHVDWMWATLDSLHLEKMTLVGQDWGGLIGLRLVAEHPERFLRVVAANTGLPTGDQPLGRAFHVWRELSQRGETLDIGGVLRSGCRSALAPEVVSAYEAPFPDERYKAGARQFPLLVPSAPDDPAAEANRQAWQVLRQWNKPFLTAFSDGDPVTRGADTYFQEQVPGARGQHHQVLAGAGHFLQEDQGETLARIVVEFMRTS